MTRQKRIPSVRCSAPSQCDVLPNALIFCFELSAHNSASLLCDVCLLLLHRSALCCERQNLAHISLSQSKLLVLALLQCPEREINAGVSLSRSKLMVFVPFLCPEREITAGISLSRERAMVSADEVTEACRKMGRLRQIRLFLTEAGRSVGRLRHLERWRHSCVSGLFFLILRPLITL